MKMDHPTQRDWVIAMIAFFIWIPLSVILLVLQDLLR